MCRLYRIRAFQRCERMRMVKAVVRRHVDFGLIRSGCVLHTVAYGRGMQHWFGFIFYS
jgi:hypothetical protein